MIPTLAYMVAVFAGAVLLMLPIAFSGFKAKGWPLFMISLVALIGLGFLTAHMHELSEQASKDLAPLQRYLGR